MEGAGHAHRRETAAGPERVRRVHLAGDPADLPGLLRPEAAGLRTHLRGREGQARGAHLRRLLRREEPRLQLPVPRDHPPGRPRGSRPGARDAPARGAQGESARPARRAGGCGRRGRVGGGAGPDGAGLPPPGLRPARGAAVLAPALQLLAGPLLGLHAAPGGQGAAQVPQQDQPERPQLHLQALPGFLRPEVLQLRPRTGLASPALPDPGLPPLRPRHLSSHPLHGGLLLQEDPGRRDVTAKLSSAQTLLIV